MRRRKDGDCLCLISLRSCSDGRENHGLWKVSSSKFEVMYIWSVMLPQNRKTMKNANVNVTTILIIMLIMRYQPLIPCMYHLFRHRRGNSINAVMPNAMLIRSDDNLGTQNDAQTPKRKQTTVSSNSYSFSKHVVHRFVIFHRFFRQARASIPGSVIRNTFASLMVHL
jgi:hypothetical protein